MFLRKRRSFPDDAAQQKVASRARLLNDSDLIDWAEQSVIVQGQDLDAYRKEHKVESLLDAQLAANTHIGILSALAARHEKD